MSPADDRLWEAFRNTTLRIETPEAGLIEVAPAEPGTTAGDFPATRAIHVVTAWNPQGEPLIPLENDFRHDALLRRLAGVLFSSIHTGSI